MKKILISLFVLFQIGCAGQQYSLPLPDNKSNYDTIATDSVTATGVHLFGIIPINLNNKVERATETLKAKYNGDAVTNVSVQERWYWAYILNIYKTEVTATVLKRKS